MWVVGLVANLVVAIAYLMIAVVITLPLARTGQLRSNRLGAATAAIFLTCAVHHGAHSVHLLGPALGYAEHAGHALRDAFTWPVVAWDVLTAVVGVYYWTLRSHYGPLMRGAALFDDLREKQRQALELNDTIMQRLVVAKMALDLDDTARSREALERSLASASVIITDLLAQARVDPDLAEGALRRRGAASLHDGHEAMATTPAQPRHRGRA